MQSRARASFLDLSGRTAIVTGASRGIGGQRLGDVAPYRNGATLGA